MNDKNNILEFRRKTEQTGKKVGARLMFGQLEVFDLSEWKETLVRTGLSSKVKERLTADMEEVAHWDRILLGRIRMIHWMVVVAIVFFFVAVVLSLCGLHDAFGSLGLFFLFSGAFFPLVWFNNAYTKLLLNWIEFWRHYAGALEDILNVNDGG